ncbi:polysaccharide deacetylase family protein [Levilactobacillus angrenensis]|uniref:Polysaccharide deacetylase family protein n=1 Tax=Levilactobacillus angrenensis TaxID=2486020 RepID=A0ABW1UBY7_9LACO|nr:polysaccharide deacetylase family protein [Levilactobacillus angrenensis]
MKRKWGLLAGCFALVIMILGAVMVTQSRHTNVRTAPATHNRLTKKDVSATEVKPTHPWVKLKHPLQLPILMYHSISTGNQLRVPQHQAVAELNYLKRHHYQTLTTTQAIRALTTNTVPQKKVVWITLDDAYKDNQKLLPTLKRNHQHVTINAITGFTHRSDHLSLAQMQVLKATGRVDFASHTVQHLDLNALTATQQKQELVDSKRWLDQHLNQNTQMLCYPAGRANPTTRRLAKQAGYRVALTTQEGVAQLSQGRYNLSRLRIIPGMPLATFADLIQVTNS